MIRKLQVSGNISPVMGHQEADSSDFKPQCPGQVPQPVLPYVIVSTHRIDETIRVQLIQILSTISAATLLHIFPWHTNKILIIGLQCLTRRRFAAICAPGKSYISAENPG